jgi:hypothetical protein
LFRFRGVAIVPIEFHVVPPLNGELSDPAWGCFMRLMHFCYAALGFAVARWIFKREALPVVDPVTRYRSQGLL